MAKAKKAPPKLPPATHEAEDPDYGEDIDEDLEQLEAETKADRRGEVADLLARAEAILEEALAGIPNVDYPLEWAMLDVKIAEAGFWLGQCPALAKA